LEEIDEEEKLAGQEIKTAISNPDHFCEKGSMTVASAALKRTHLEDAIFLDERVCALLMTYWT
jgi:hypothetical protein